jgi:YVTN family beta-propeller protein
MRQLAVLLLAAVVPASVSSGLGGHPSGGLLLVLNREEDSLAIFDAATLRILGRVQTGEQPHEIAVSDDGRLAFIANYGTEERPGETITVVDIAGQKEVRRVSLGALRRPHGITVSRGKVYFTAEGSMAVGRYDPVSDRVDWVLGTGQIKTHTLVATPDSRKIYAANAGSNTVSVIEQDPAIGLVKLDHIPVGAAPEGLDLSPDGSEVWVAHLGDGRVSIIDTATEKVTKIIDAGRSPIRLTFTPDGKKVVVVDLAGEVIVFDAARRRELKRIQVGSFPTGVLVSPDSRYAFVSAGGDNSVYVIDLERLERTAALRTGKGPDGLAWVGRPSSTGEAQK